MKLAIMQPYLFPYVGYFQMIKAVDVFVIYDDVNFIKQGWINRNKLLINNKDFMFTVPLQKANSFCNIKDTLINEKSFENWKLKFQQTIIQNYKKAPNFSEVYELLKIVFSKNHKTISELAVESIIEVSNYLSIDTVFLKSSERFSDNAHLKKEYRLIDICLRENATKYINAIGGLELYNKEFFKKYGVELIFIKSLPITYKQFDNEFVPWLSIIDVLMFNSKEKVLEMLDEIEFF